ncbi:hypothetical protein [Rhizobium phaseoli]|uniref:hypothetical protein n=1 Tax=Rhizobium phaseoli TaxID=396 RepID=UPI000BE88798|nr:hypothetical protein [Rhizobium phaseoli]PDS72505.1 hypothetical protein CO651_07580 [Rhizobium phaseoli]
MAKTNLVRPSRDGDQFHYLWAARRCLKLLSATSDLVAVTIEGISPEEAGSGATITAGEDVIDIAEYFGSEDFADSRLVRYMQLKHSTLHAHEPWTASGLENSIKGFAERYRELLKTFPQDVLARKLEFWFVTNRPIGKVFTETVEDIAEGGTVRHIKEIEKLERFAGISGDALAAFCRLIHFEARQDDYWNQRNILFQDVSGYLPDSDVYGPLKLKELVTRKALSEGERNPSITKMRLDLHPLRLFWKWPISQCIRLSPPAQGWVGTNRKRVSEQRALPFAHSDSSCGFGFICQSLRSSRRTSFRVHTSPRPQSAAVYRN